MEKIWGPEVFEVKGGEGGRGGWGGAVSLGREDVGPQTAAAALSAPPITFTAVLARNAAAAQSAAALSKAAGGDALLSAGQA